VPSTFTAHEKAGRETSQIVDSDRYGLITVGHMVYVGTARRMRRKTWRHVRQ
jgi:hypothetical protein